MRGHAKGKAERRAILRRAAKFVPAMAKAAMEKDREAGLI